MNVMFRESVTGNQKVLFGKVESANDADWFIVIEEWQGFQWHLVELTQKLSTERLFGRVRKLTREGFNHLPDCRSCRGYLATRGEPTHSMGHAG